MNRYLAFAALLMFNSSILFSQEQEKENVDVKKGFNYGVLPTVTYNTDLGFQYGGLLDLYYYGDGSTYPKYLDRYYLEISRFTKGSGINRFSYESNRLFEGRTVFFDLNYQPDEQFDFLGANGYESVYNANWEDPLDPDYKSKMFYKNQTKRLKAKFDVLHPITDNWYWVSGMEYYYFKVNSLDASKYNDGRDQAEQIPGTDVMPGLWDRYKKWGLIDPKNADGGSFLGLKLGAMYDSRNNWTNATEGIWSELTFVYAPNFLGNNSSSFIKINLTHRQYFTIIQDRLSFAYRLGYSGNLIGTEPYFALPIMYSVMIKGATDEGLGGAKSLRGIRRNRVVGDGEAYANIELRYKFVKFRMFNQNFYIATNIFADAGQAIQLLPLKEKVQEIESTVGPLTDANVWGVYAADSMDNYFNFGAEKIHISFGLGLKFAMNENFVVSVDFGKTLNEQDGPAGMYVGLNYAF